MKACKTLSLLWHYWRYFELLILSIINCTSAHWLCDVWAGAVGCMNMKDNLWIIALAGLGWLGWAGLAGLGWRCGQTETEAPSLLGNIESRGCVGTGERRPGHWRHVHHERRPPVQVPDTQLPHQCRAAYPGAHQQILTCVQEEYLLRLRICCLLK